jgi:hypothetical protein
MDERYLLPLHLELVFLLIDEHCNGGIILETDGHKLANLVLFRDGNDGRMDPTPGSMGAGGGQGEKAAPPSGGGFSMAGLGGDMTITQALMQVRNQIISNLSQS